MTEQTHKLTSEEREKASREVVQSYIATTALYDFNVYEKRVLYNLVKLAQSQIEGIRLADNLYRIEHGLGDFLKDCPRGPKFQNYPFVNTALQAVAEKEPQMGFVSAEGLGANPDNLHFSAAALREFGLRYYAEFLKLEDPNRVYEQDLQRSAEQSDIELL